MAKPGECKNCTYYELLERPIASGFAGECHFNPPDSRVGFVVVRDDDWCSHYDDGV